MEVLNCLQNTYGFEETKTKLQELKLIVKEYPEMDLYLVKYNKQECDMSNNDVKNCRGLIAQMSNNKLVCLPPIKSEIYRQDQDWSKVRVEDFIDGTNINLFYHNGEWKISTRSNIGANCRWSSNRYFSDLFTESSTSINFAELDQDLFYSFVLLHPENIIVTKYTIPTIVLISVGKVSDGKYINMGLENVRGYYGQFPFVHNFETIDQANEYVSKLDFQYQGLVLKYGDNFERRSKIRNSNYNYVKCLKGNTNNLKYVYLESLQNKTTTEYLNFFPEHTELFNGFNKEFKDMIQTIYNNYTLYHKRKEIDIKDIPYQYRRLCYELHGLYIQDKKNINYSRVYDYIISLQVPRILHAINYDYKQH
jgi:hypothetical protein